MPGRESSLQKKIPPQQQIQFVNPKGYQLKAYRIGFVR